MGLREALDHIPLDLTYAIRIHSSHRIIDRFYKPLNGNGMCRSHDYTFDDLPRGNVRFLIKERVHFTQDIAERIITDFKEGIEDCKEVLVHCLRGKNRGPSIGMALNDIFNLGQDPTTLRDQYPEHLEHVYDLMMETAGYSQ